MALFNFHRVLISGYILFDLFFTLLCVRRWLDGAGSIQIVMGVGSSVITLGLIVYLVNFNRRMRIHDRSVLESGEPSVHASGGPTSM